MVVRDGQPNALEEQPPLVRSPLAPLPSAQTGTLKDPIEAMEPSPEQQLAQRGLQPAQDFDTVLQVQRALAPARWLPFQDQNLFVEVLTENVCVNQQLQLAVGPLRGGASDIDELARTTAFI